MAAANGATRRRVMGHHHAVLRRAHGWFSRLVIRRAFSPMSRPPCDQPRPVLVPIITLREKCWLLFYSIIQKSGRCQGGKRVFKPGERGHCPASLPPGNIVGAWAC